MSSDVEEGKDDDGIVVELEGKVKECMMMSGKVVVVVNGVWGEKEVEYG